MISSVIAVPRSGSRRMSPTSPPTTTPIGTSAYGMSSMRSIRRSSRAAMKKIALSFASSDGCTPNPPRPNQRRLPLIGVLNRTTTRAHTTNPSAIQMNVGCL